MIGLTFDELANYRESDGFINLDSLFADDIEVEREVRGNDKRDKDWFDIGDGSVMFKSNAEEQLYAHYSEMICCELAKQAGLQTARYDFAKRNGQIGVITKDVCAPGEELLTINELIGTGPTDPEYPDSTDIYYVFDMLEAKLLRDGYDQTTVDSCMLELRKQLLFDLHVMETDRHTENLSFIVGKDKNTGKPTIRLSPMYDTESALVLYDDAEHMKKVWSSMMVTAEVTNLQEPKICVIPYHDDELGDGAATSGALSFLEQLQSQVGYEYASESEEMWKSTLDFLVEDPRAESFATDVLSKMNISQAIQAVEQAKGCTIPEEVKQMAIACFEDRKSAIAFELGLDLDMEYSDIRENELT